MTLFVALSWTGCLLTTVGFVVLFGCCRYMFVKPSLIVLMSFHIIQWSATLSAAQVEAFLPDPLAFLVLVQGFPLLGLLGSAMYGHDAARGVWDRITGLRPLAPRGAGLGLAIAMLGGLIAVVVAGYFTNVPLHRTGLFTILTNPTESSQAREESLKLLTNVPLKYAFLIMAMAIAPFLAVLIALKVGAAARARQWLMAGAAIVGLVALVCVVSLTGARSFAAALMLTLFIALMYRRGLPFNPLLVALAIAAVLFLPVTLSILREGRELSLEYYMEYLTEHIFRRVFFVPAEAGMYYVHFAQTQGFVGLSGIPKLAAYFGEAAIELPNHVGRMYTGSRLESISMNTGSLFSYYTCFGLAALPLTLLGLWALDLALLAYGRLPDHLVLACVATAAVLSRDMNSSEYTTMLLTHGFVPLFVVVLLLQHFVATRLARGPQPRKEDNGDRADDLGPSAA